MSLPSHREHQRGQEVQWDQSDHEHHPFQQHHQVPWHQALPDIMEEDCD